ncbi:hypothetical protein ACEPAF_2149 [Sanghuangporus sanghuang]
MGAGSHSESHGDNASPSAIRDVGSSVTERTSKTDKREINNDSTGQEDNERRLTSPPKAIPLGVARYQVEKYYRSHRPGPIYSLFEKTIEPAKKYEAVERMRLAVEDVLEKLTLTYEAERSFERDWTRTAPKKTNEEISKVKAKRREESGKEARKRLTVGTSAEDRNRVQQVEQDLRQCENNLLVEDRKVNQCTGEWRRSVTRIHTAFMKILSIDVLHDDWNEELLRFCKIVTEYVILRCENLGDIKVAFSLANNASVALKDWSEIYDWKAIQKVKEGADAFKEQWFGSKFNGDSKNTREDIVDEAKKELERIQEEAIILAAQGREKEEKTIRDVEGGLNQAMEDMRKIYEASQKEPKKKNSRWYRIVDVEY